MFLGQFAKQTAGSHGVAPALDNDVENKDIENKDVENKDVENKALPVNRSPQPVFAPGDGDHDLVEMPFVAALRRSLPDAAGKDLTETATPIAGPSHG